VDPASSFALAMAVDGIAALALGSLFGPHRHPHDGAGDDRLRAAAPWYSWQFTVAAVGMRAGGGDGRAGIG